ncbi:TPA: macro domain-containing protein [Vibrio parahaemolyticus]|uniref:type II toxin-antitoxin system antitoxin DNA ADP-ribosyl glycohydrolase DarG n=1 Tax=Vibrio parahaemolyticus TaxID=670 RepID=UPI000A388965|nr:macro domain-containing protein [Vibrio parahaemolyticus]EHK7404365.1 macro domain-containing protein [Vibrio parahaemolyticus]MDF4625003.1 macro domain-containing protein [Vibrio parahaemolyticus]MDG2639195.1 macro domain-containing protein [Vibrio parahaemolyticus]OUJ42265.1 ADP-ribose-binding protein [Vibrio parahaemolyticus]HBC3457134.1 macro domain-containing protein [Vibrio parahaemolyticus]
MIKYLKGDLFSDHAEALVNTVNTVGVMGKGLAYQFKEKYPENFLKYRDACKNKELTTGTVLTVPIKEPNGPHYVINFPTKEHWKGKSKIEYIESGLDALISTVDKHNISSVAIPALGSGLGGLPWSQVEQVLIRKLETIERVEWRIYAPTETPKKQSPTRITFGRAVLIVAIEQYVNQSRKDNLSEQELQCLMYILLNNGIEISSIIFDKYLDSPFSSVLHESLKKMDGSLLYISGINKSIDSTRININKDHLKKSREKIRTENNIYNIIRKTIDIISGYQSNEGMAIISSVLWVVNNSSKDTDNVVENTWKRVSKQKGVTRELIKGAITRLNEENIISYKI